MGPEADNLLAISPPVLELLGRHVLRHLQVRRRRLQVLPKGQDVHACNARAFTGQYMTHSASLSIPPVNDNMLES